MYIWWVVVLNESTCLATLVMNNLLSMYACMCEGFMTRPKIGIQHRHGGLRVAYPSLLLLCDITHNVPFVLMLTERLIPFLFFCVCLVRKIIQKGSYN